jgi:hypothetical protein
MKKKVGGNQGVGREGEETDEGDEPERVQQELPFGSGRRRGVDLREREDLSNGAEEEDQNESDSLRAIGGFGKQFHDSEGGEKWKSRPCHREEDLAEV